MINSLFRNGILLFVTGIVLNACNSDETHQNSNTKIALKEKEGNWQGCMVSAYIFEESGRRIPDDFEHTITGFEKLIDHEIGSVMWYPTFADPFPMNECNKLKATGIIPHLTWELFFPDSIPYNTVPLEENYALMDEVLAGTHDAYIDQFAKDAKAFGGKVWVRFLHEFNGNWYVWSGAKNGREKGGPQKVVAVWRYVVDRFRAIGADKVKWIWNPHGPSIDVSEDAWNDIKNYWPGNDYVDWIGMDAYNWYPKDPWGGERPFRDFDNCFRKLYDECVALGDQPIMIAEFATPEFEYEGKTKADWINDAMNKIKTDYPRIKLFVWFHIKKELDWRINSSPESLNAFKNAIQDPYFTGKIKGNH
jgi:hypothetical protein